MMIVMVMMMMMMHLSTFVAVATERKPETLSYSLNLRAATEIHLQRAESREQRAESREQIAFLDSDGLFDLPSTQLPVSARD